MSSCRARLLVPVVTLLMGAPCAGAARPDDVRAPVGTVPAEVATARDVARIDGDATLRRIVLVLPRRDPQGLARLLSDQQDPTSPSFHRWLSPEEFERRFGAPDEDVAALRDWLESNGLDVESVPAGRAVLVFSGRAADVERAFDTELHEVLSEGRVRITNVRSPRLPLDLVRRVTGVLSLNSFPRRQTLVRRAPAVTSGSGHSLAPADFTAIYNVDALAAAGLNGSGVKIGVLAETNVKISDTTFFRQYYGLPANDPVVVLNGPDPGIVTTPLDDELESDLDLQWAGGVAPAARVLLIASQTTETTYGVDLSAAYAVANNLADVLTLSYGGCEKEFDDVSAALYQNVWAQAAAQGISVMVASGDSGATGCVVASGSLGVNGLGSSPYATCVGGTQFLDSENPSAYWNSANDATTKRSVKGYIPETTWNEASGSTGGGQSVWFALPPWQNVSGVPGGGGRWVPDLALAASTRVPYNAVRAHTTGTTGVFQYGGTSFSSPAFAGITALLIQKAGGRLGNMNPLLYAVGRTQFGSIATAPVAPVGPAVFHDVTTGSNSFNGTTGFSAGPGYDAATGLGSVDASLLAAALPAPAPGTTDFTLGASPGAPVLPAGGSVVVTLTLAQAGNASGDAVATVSLAGVPAGVTAEFQPGNPANVSAGVLSRAQAATLTFRSQGTPAAGTYRVDLTATSGSVVRRLALFLTVGSLPASPPTGIGVQEPVVLDVFGAGGSHYTSDLVAVNRSGADVTLLLRFAQTPAASPAGPTVARSLAAGRQLFVPDVIAFLNANGYALPADGSAKLGTLFATFVGAADPLAVYVGSRTSTPNPNTTVGGAFGTFSAAVPDGVASSGDAWIYGLRENASFRSNLAVVHAPGSASGAISGPVTLEIQLYDGDSGAPVGAPLVRTLQPGEFYQYNRILSLTSTGVTNGYARVHPTSGSDRFVAYGVVNDGPASGGGTSDGSFLPANATEGLIPVVLDVPAAAHFTSDLTLTNPTSAPVTATLTYTASTAFSGAGSGSRGVMLLPRQQLVVPNAITYLRGLGLPIPTTGNQGGTLLVGGVAALARTSNPNPDATVGGTFGLAYPAVASASRAKGEAWVYGLRQDADVRTNLAIADARAGDASSVTYVVDVFDADTGGATPVLTKQVALTGGQWTQFNTILAEAGIAHGYARVRPSSGLSDFVVYGVVNDGPTAGSRTSDGSYVPMVVVK